jgi:hypothetical protein
VDHDLTENQKRALEGIVAQKSINDFYFFAKHVLDFELLTDETHKKWAKNLEESIYNNKHLVMRLKPRGTYKTTLYGVAFILWLWACFSSHLRIFYTSSNDLLLAEVSDKIGQFVGTIKQDTLYSQIFGIVKDPMAKNTSEVFNIKGRSGKGFSLILRTSGGSTVGIHPNVILIDDPLNQKDRESAAERKAKKSCFDTLIPLLVPFYH